MMKFFNDSRFFIVIVFFLCFVPHLGYASGSLRCEGRLVSLGDTKQEVKEICGSATFVDINQEQRVFKTYYSKADQNPEHKNQYEFISERAQFVVIEEWTYNFGSSRFIQTLTFRDNRLVVIKDGSYGFDKIDNDFNVRKGDSRVFIVMKYGEPIDIQRQVTYQTHVIRELDDDYLYEETRFTPIVDEEWIYDLGPDQYLQQLNFTNGSLVKVKSLKVKGKKISNHRAASLLKGHDDQR